MGLTIGSSNQGFALEKSLSYDDDPIREGDGRSMYEVISCRLNELLRRYRRWRHLMGLRRTVADLTTCEQAALADFQRRVDLASPGVSARYIVFGSRARGTADAESDLDVCVELDVERLSFADKQKIRRIA